MIPLLGNSARLWRRVRIGTQFLIALALLALSGLPAAAQKKEAVNCVIYMKYDPDKGDKEHGVAFNADIKASAEAEAGAIGGASVIEVNNKVTLADALASFTEKGKKCCKRIEILGHGQHNGSLDLPYENKSKEELSDAEKKEAGATSLGGSYADKTAVGGIAKAWLSKFVKDVKAALCPEIEDAKDKPTATFHSCWSAGKDGGPSIAQQVADHTDSKGKNDGVPTKGYTGTGQFPQEEGKKDGGQPPRPKEESGSKVQTFETHSMLITPGRPGLAKPSGEYVAYTVPVATDGGNWCSYGEGKPIALALIDTDESGAPIASRALPTALAERTPVAAPPRTSDQTPTISDQPPTTAKTPAPPVDRPPPTAAAPPVTPDTPTTDAPPVTPPATDAPPPQIPDTIFVKANEAVLEGGQTGSELQNQTVKLVFTKPDLPGGGTSKTAQDTGFDRDPAQCTTGAGGECKIQVHPDDRPLYGLASSGAKPAHYRLDLNLLKHSGAVAETTGKSGKPDLKNATPAGGNVTDAEFKIGNRKFTRLGIDQPYGRSEDRAAYSRALGPNAETDYCRTKKPGPPLGMEPASLGALNHELPEAALKLDGRVRAGRTVR